MKLHTRKSLGRARKLVVKSKLPQVCVTCGSEENLTIDHKLARSLGGTNELANLQMMCASCNQAKAVGEARELDSRRREFLQNINVNPERAVAALKIPSKTERRRLFRQLMADNSGYPTPST